MKKLILFYLLLPVLLLAGCQCSHQWRDANCDVPAFCQLCGETQGDALGHDWQEATCTHPRQCLRCGATQGQPTSHNWQDAICQAPKTCSGCGATEGEPGAHHWIDATTESPKLCLYCGAADGEKLNTDPRFTTTSTLALQGIWVCDYDLPAKVFGLEAYMDTVSCTLFYRFGPTGTLEVAVTTPEDSPLLSALQNMTLDFIYGSYPDRATADREIQAAKGMTTAEYAMTTAQKTASTIFDSLFSGGVYYVADGMCYLGSNWDGDFTSGKFTVSEDTLVLEAVTILPDGEPPVWTKLSS